MQTVSEEYQNIHTSTGSAVKLVDYVDGAFTSVLIRLHDAVLRHKSKFTYTLIFITHTINFKLINTYIYRIYQQQTFAHLLTVLCDSVLAQVQLMHVSVLICYKIISLSLCAFRQSCFVLKIQTEWFHVKVPVIMTNDIQSCSH